jgi:flagellar biogenesis protein FliO
MNAELLAAAMKMLTPLLVLLGGLLVGAYFLKKTLRREGGYSAKRLVKVLGSTPLGIKKHISLVEVPGAILVVGVTAETITLLATLENEEIVARVKEGGQGGPTRSFAEQLQGLTSSMAKDAQLLPLIGLGRGRKTVTPAGTRTESKMVW